MDANEPKSLEALIAEMEEHSRRKDLSDEYLEEQGNSVRNIGEYSYGISMVPVSWVLPYLEELKKIKDEKTASEKV